MILASFSCILIPIYVRSGIVLTILPPIISEQIKSFPYVMLTFPRLKYYPHSHSISSSPSMLALKHWHPLDSSHVSASLEIVIQPIDLMIVSHLNIFLFGIRFIGFFIKDGHLPQKLLKFLLFLNWWLAVVFNLKKCLVLVNLAMLCLKFIIQVSMLLSGVPRINKLEIEGRGFHTNLYAVRGTYSGGKEGKSRIQWLRSMVGSPDLISIQGTLSCISHWTMELNRNSGMCQTFLQNCSSSLLYVYTHIKILYEVYLLSRKVIIIVNHTLLWVLNSFLKLMDNICSAYSAEICID